MISWYDLAQWLIVIMAVLLSALYMLGRIAPGWRVALAMRLQQSRYPRWINVIGTRIAGGGACGSGCSSCDSCPANSSSSKK